MEAGAFQHDGEGSRDRLPEVSIIILNYNGRTDLASCLASLAGLRYPTDRLETMVVDNASTDDSVAWLKREHPEVRLVISPANVGFSAGINLGAKHASGALLALLNPDTRVDQNWLLALLQTMQGSEDVVCAASVVLNWRGNKIDYVGRPNDALYLLPGVPQNAHPKLESLADGPLLYASGGAMLIQRDVFLRLGGFDPDFFMYHEDVDLGWRLWLSGYRVLLSARSLVYHKGGESARRLPPENVMCMAQKHTVHSLLRNLDTEQLQIVLPGVLWHFVRRARWFTSARLSLGQAMRELTGEIDAIWRKREATQAQRVRSDSELFAICGHPFGAVLSEAGYQEFMRYLEGEGMPAAFPDDPAAARQRISWLLYHAYKFNYEQLLGKPESFPLNGAIFARWLVRRILPHAWRHRLAPLWRSLTRP